MRKVLIIGANRGLGLEFARQYAAEGCHVVATARRPAEALELRRIGVQVEALDSRDGAAIEALAKKLSEHTFDVVVCNAGIYGPRTDALADVFDEDFDLVMRTNVLGPLRIALVFAPHVAPVRGTMAFLSSRMGSIATMAGANAIAYRSSKAALNAVVKAAAIDLGRRGVRVMALHPGWVRTDMGGEAATLSVQDSVGGMRHVIARGGELHGGFFDYTGTPVPW